MATRGTAFISTRVRVALVLGAVISGAAGVFFGVRGGTPAPTGVTVPEENRAVDIPSSEPSAPGRFRGAATRVLMAARAMPDDALAERTTAVTPPPGTATSPRPGRAIPSAAQAQSAAPSPSHRYFIE